MIKKMINYIKHQVEIKIKIKALIVQVVKEDQINQIPV
jgi:hypothetical protein